MKTPALLVLELATDEELLTVVGNWSRWTSGDFKGHRPVCHPPHLWQPVQGRHCRAHPARHLWGDFKVPLLRAIKGLAWPSPAAWWTPLGTRPWR